MADTPANRAVLGADIRAATGLDEAVLERLVRAFYGAARDDALLAPAFARVHDWEAHIHKIVAFWSSVALMTGEYHGRPLPAHIPLDLRPADFGRWLELFEATARGICTPQGAAYLMEKAERIARSFELGIAVHRGELPVRTTR